LSYVLLNALFSNHEAHEGHEVILFEVFVFFMVIKQQIEFIPILLYIIFLQGLHVLHGEEIPMISYFLLPHFA